MIYLHILLLSMIVVYLIYLSLEIRDIVKKLRFERRCKKMLLKIIEKCGCTGVLELPKIDGPYARDAMSGAVEYIFTEFADTGLQRTIYISDDCNFIHALPWKSKNK